MYTAMIENAKGNLLELTGNETEYQVVSIIGLNPPAAQINTSTVVGLDGAKFNSAKLDTRQIVITLRINGNVESNRQMIYSYVPTKQWCKFYFQNANRNVYIEGYVQTVEVDLFSQSELIQIAILCPQPYFKALDEVIDDISKVKPLFFFPFSIEIDSPEVISSLDENKITNILNASETETGFSIQITFNSAASTIKLWNTDTGEEFTLDYAFQKGDVVTINTTKGQKAVSLLRNATTTNLFTAIQQGSVFFQLETGDNHFTYQVDNGADDNEVDIQFIHNTLYRGV